MPLSKLKEIQSRKGSEISVAEEPGVTDGASEEQRRLMVARAAYLRAQARGFEAGHEEEDWYAAETEIEQAFGQ